MEFVFIIAISAILFAKTVKYGLVSDDIPREGDRELEPFHRPIIYNPKMKVWQSHVINIVIHTLNCCLIHFVFGRNVVSFCAAILFCANPINMQGGSVWLSGRTYATNATLVLLFFWIPLIALPLYALSQFFAASSLFAPFAFVATPYPYMAILPICALPYFFKRVITRLKASEKVSKEMLAFHPSKFIPFVKTFGQYTLLSIIPYELGLYHHFLWGLGVTQEYDKKHFRINWDFWRGVLVILTISVGIALGNPILRLGLVWWAINISMWCNFVTIQQQFSERYVYLANIGLMLALSSALITYLPFPLFGYVLSGLLVYYITRLLTTMKQYKNEWWLTEMNIIEQPQAHYAWIMRGIKAYGGRNLVEASKCFQECIFYNPIEFKGYFNLANVQLVMGNVKGARENLTKAEPLAYNGDPGDYQKQYLNQAWELLKEMEQNMGKDYQLDLRRVSLQT